MRKVVAALLLMLTTSLVCVDQVACPDGSTDDAQEQGTAPAPMPAYGECLLCQSAVSVAVTIPPLVINEAVQQHYRAPLGRVVLSPAVAIEHPPRPA